MSNPIHWKKSSRSVNDESCIELSHDLRFIRDSKDPSGPVLAVDATTLLRAVRTGRFNR